MHQHWECQMVTKILLWWGSEVLCRRSPLHNTYWSLAISMLGFVLMMPSGHIKLASMELGIWMRMPNGYSNSEQNLNPCLRNTYFSGSKWKRVSWHHLCSVHWHQLNLVLVHYKQIQSLLHTATCHSADWDKDHALVHLKICLPHLRRQKKGTSDSV